MFLIKLTLLVLMPLSLFAKSPQELTVYTSRKTHLIEPLFEAYSKKTGVKIKHINGKAGALIQKIKQEGGKTPADLLITVDAGNLSFAAEQGLLSKLTSKILLTSVGEENRGQGNQWVGLSLRARTLFYNKSLVKKNELKNYADLSDKKWKGRLCLRTSRKVYNQSLVAAMIKRVGEKETQEVVSGWVKNLAKPVFTSDTLLLKAINKGVCQVGIANTYYLARLIKKGEAKNVNIFWPTEKQGGVHVNVSGAGVVRKSKNQKAAVLFLEWLVTKEAQQIFAGLNDEYPVVKDVKISKILEKWGTFDRESTPLTSIGQLQKKAVLLMDAAKYR